MTGRIANVLNLRGPNFITDAPGSVLVNAVLLPQQGQISTQLDAAPLLGGQLVGQGLQARVQALLDQGVAR